MSVSIWAILTGAILPVLGYFIFHKLAKAREASSRKYQASNDFRAKIITYAARLPGRNEHWGGGSNQGTNKH